MKAVLQREYGGVDKLSLEDVKNPSIKSNEVLVEIHVANVASGDMRINTLDVAWILKPILRLVFGLFGPRRKIRGITASGVIKEVGSDVTKFIVGDRVNFINSMKAGCIAEFVALPEKAVMAKISDDVTFEEAAPVAFGAMTANHFLNEDTVKEGMNVLIYGASGSVGSYAVSLAKALGAKVVAVGSYRSLDILTEIGADIAIDYTTNEIDQLNQKFDLIFDSVMKLDKQKAKSMLKETGKIYTTASPTSERVDRLVFLNDLLAKKKLVTVIDKSYQLSDFMDAHKLVYSKQKMGNVVIRVKDKANQ